MNIVLLGSGNVATHMGHAFTRAGCRIVQVYSRTLAHAASLAEAVGAEAIDVVDGVNRNADAFVVAVKDDAIHDVICQMPEINDGMVLHTAGSVGMDIFAGCVPRYGVLYPVQTFSKAKAIDFSSVPLAVEASDDRTLAGLRDLAGRLSSRVFVCDSKQRLSLHVAAVFACNFANHCYAVADELLKVHKLDFELIRPLILETAEKVMKHRPRDVQTGPAVRRDATTMAKHLTLLQDDPDLVKLYTLLSEHIGRS